MYDLAVPDWWVTEQGQRKGIQGLVGSMLERSWGSTGWWEAARLAREERKLRLGSRPGWEGGWQWDNQKNRGLRGLFQIQNPDGRRVADGHVPKCNGTYEGLKLSHSPDSLGLLFFPQISFTSAWKPKESLLSYSWLIKQIQTYAQPHSAFSLRAFSLGREVKCGWQVYRSMQKVVSAGVGGQQGRSIPRARHASWLRDFSGFRRVN